MGAMVIGVTNIITRYAGRPVTGVYEISGLILVIAGGFGLVYAALTKSHITVPIVVSHLPQRLQTILKCFTSFISLSIWAIITWATFDLTCERLFVREESEILNIPYVPFRFIWLFALILFCLVYLLDLIKALRQLVRK